MTSIPFARTFGHLDGLKVAIVGDLSHSRVVGSLVPALKTMGAEVVLVGPPTFHVDDPSWFGCYQTSHFDEVIGDVDVVYMLRVQLERMEGAPIPSRRESQQLWGLDERRSKLMKPEAIICHPRSYEPWHWKLTARWPIALALVFLTRSMQAF